MEKAYKTNKPLALAVFLVVGLLVSGPLLLRKTGVTQEKGIGVGPLSPIVNSAQGAGPDETAVLVESQGMTALSSLPGAVSLISLSSNLGADATLQDPGLPIDPAVNFSGVVSYKVKRGDTLSSVASRFGISVASVMGANPAMKSKALRAGETLTILPAAGAVYATQSGDTLGSISAEFNVPEDKLAQFNQSVNFSSLSVGTSIMIPGETQAEVASAEASASISAPSAIIIPTLNTQLIAPTQGYTWHS